MSPSPHSASSVRAFCPRSLRIHLLRHRLTSLCVIACLLAISACVPSTRETPTPSTDDVSLFVAGSERIYVDADATGRGDGNSWQNAFTNLPDALNAARNTATKEIWIAEGIYYPDEGGNVTVVTNTVTINPAQDHRNATFYITEGVKLYGGFVGNETALSQRNPDTNVVILSGDIDENDAVSIVTDTDTQIHGSNAYHVLYIDGTTTTITEATVIDGVTITAGQANGRMSDFRGGAILNRSSSPTLNNVTFSGNSASIGGAMFNGGSSPTLNDVTFLGNISDFGGAMSNERGSSPILNRVTFSGNTAVMGYGGAIHNSRSSVVINNATFTGNSADIGGAIFNRDNSSLTLSNATLSDNTVSNSGGAIYNETADVTLDDIIFTSNSADFSGGAVYSFDSRVRFDRVVFRGNTAESGGATVDARSDSTFVNTTFTGNAAGYDGGAMLNLNVTPELTNVVFERNRADVGGAVANRDISRLTLTNVTFVNNRARRKGGAILNDQSGTELTNVILWGNVAAERPNQIDHEDTTEGLLVIRHSIVEGGQDGITGGGNTSGYDTSTNFAVDPLFANTNASGLRACSPAIDTGDDDAVSLSTDIAGNPRKVNSTGLDGFGRESIVDMGAFEFQGDSSNCPSLLVDRDPNRSVALNAHEQ